MGCISSTTKPIYTLKKDDVFNVSVVRVQSDHPMSMASHGFIEITPHELIYFAQDEEPVAWSLQHLRRYGLTGNIFSFEAGRRCPTGRGIYTFRCCNADQLYSKFQRSINSLSVVAERSNSSTHPSHIFGRLESHQAHANHYLEPTSVHVSALLDEPVILPESFVNTSSDYNLNSPDLLQSTTLPEEIIHFPSPTSYSNVGTNPTSTCNIYMEQPTRMNSEHNNNISEHDILTTANHYKSVLKPLLKSSSLDMPPEECAPMLYTKTVETQRIYENVDSSATKSASNSQNSYNKSADRFYANVEFLPKLETNLCQNKSFQLDLLADHQQSTSANGSVVNYIILDLDQPRSPSLCSPKNRFGSGQSLSGGGEVSNLKNEVIPSAAVLSCGSSTMPKGSKIVDDCSKLPKNELESSGSYTRIDFLKTFALMKSSNYTDFELENDQEESRITRHSKFVRKAYSISE